MQENVRVRHPKQDDKLPPSFVAFGDVTNGTRQVRGMLVDSLSGEALGAGLTLRPPPAWAIQFRSLNPGGPYTLVITDEEGQTLARVTGLTVTGEHGVGILYPGNNAQLCRTFYSYGTTNDPGQILGVLIKGSTTINGSTIGNGPYWTIQFANVPVDTYDEIRISSSVASDSRTAIQVNNC